EFFALPFGGQFNNIAVASALFCGQFIHSELETLTRREIGDANYIKLLAHPPSIYYGRLGSYPLCVPRGSIPIRFRLPILKRIRQLMCNFIQNVHSVLPPPLSANCYEAFMYVIATDGDKSIPMVVHRGDFFQHRYPSANPFLSLAETGYLRSAAGYFRFYGAFDLADTIDDLLQLTVPDEDVVSTLLHEYHLDRLYGTGVYAVSSLDDRCALTERMRQEQRQFYQDNAANPDFCLPPSTPTHFLPAPTTA
ncbi:hypothetical protein HYDPIDRAFT_31930, partial [Hydnomerulius pinastri MD-312]